MIHEGRLYCNPSKKSISCDRDVECLFLPETPRSRFAALRLLRAAHGGWMQIETGMRSMGKAISWRVLGTVATATLVYFFTGHIGVAFTIGGIEAVSKSFLYFFHERIWNRIQLGKRNINPKVIWFTGLSGSGKSTIANRVYEELRAKGLKVERLDGDSIRDLFPTTGFSREAREEHVKRIGHLASYLEKHGVFVICSFISPFQDSRKFVRSLCKNFVEVYVSTSLEECERRDVKGLYAKARAGEIKNFTGVSDPYEPPVQPEIEIDTSLVSLEQASQMILKRIGRW